MKNLILALCMCGVTYKGIYIDCTPKYSGWEYTRKDGTHYGEEYMLTRREIGEKCKIYIDSQKYQRKWLNGDSAGADK